MVGEVALRFLLGCRDRSGGEVFSTSLSMSVAAKSLPNEVSPKPADEKSAQSVGEAGEIGEADELPLVALPFPLAAPP